MTKEVLKNVKKKKKKLPREVLISNDVNDKIGFKVSCVDYVQGGDSLELHLQNVQQLSTKIMLISKCAKCKGFRVYLLQ